MTTQSAPSGGPAACPHQEMISGSYVRNAWYVAAWSDDIGDGQLVARTIMDEPIVLYRKADGSVAAIEDRCAHRFAPLSMGKIVRGDRIQCPYHGLEFDGTGACVHNPHGAKTIPSRARLKSYPVVESTRRSGSGWATRRPTPAKCRTSACSTTCRRLHTTKRDSIVIRANYQLIIDNLLDLSHTSYLHEGISAMPTPWNPRSPSSRTATMWWSAGTPPIRRRPACSLSSGRTIRPRVDKFTKMRWMAPSTLRLVTGICKMGAAPDTGTGYHAIHMLTPENRPLDAVSFHRGALWRDDVR